MYAKAFIVIIGTSPLQWLPPFYTFGAAYDLARERRSRGEKVAIGRRDSIGNTSIMLDFDEDI